MGVFRLPSENTAFVQFVVGRWAIPNQGQDPIAPLKVTTCTYDTRLSPLLSYVSGVFTIRISWLRF